MSAVKTLSVGIIGCGVVGQVHAAEAAACEHLRVGCCCDLNLAAAQALADAHPGARVSSDAMAVIADPDIDLIVLGLPTGFRFPLAEAALKAGKHLLLEKPVAMNADEVRALQAIQGQAVVACCSSRMSLMAHARVAQRAIADGRLGEIRSIHAWATGPVGGRPQQAPPAWRVSHRLNGGGLCMNWGVYDLDFLLGCCSWQLTPQSLLAQCWQVAPALSDRVAPGSDAETHLMLALRFAEGAMLQLERAEFTSAQPRSEWQICGSLGTLRLHLWDPAAPVILTTIDPETGLVEETMHHVEDDETGFMTGVLSDLAAAIVVGRRPQTDLDRSLTLARICDGIYASAASGTCVDLS